MIIFGTVANDGVMGYLLIENGQLMEIKSGEMIHYTTSLTEGWLDLLFFVPENVLYQIIENVAQLGFSAYDSVFSSFHPFHCVSFFQF